MKTDNPSLMSFADDVKNLSPEEQTNLRRALGLVTMCHIDNHPHVGLLIVDTGDGVMQVINMSIGARHALYLLDVAKQVVENIHNEPDKDEHLH